MAGIRAIVGDLVAGFGLTRADADTFLDHAHGCFASPWSEDKLGGVLLLAEHGRPRLTIGHVEALGRPLAGGLLADWNSVDWYCVKVIGPFLTDGDDIERRCRAVARWTGAPSLWQRRAAAVAFVNHAATEPELFDGFTELLLDIADANSQDPARWSQTSVGWLLRELARRRPDDVCAFLTTHPHLCAEARKNASKHVTCP